MNFKKLFLVSILCLFSSVSWSNKCVQGDCKNGLGAYTFTSGSKYVGEFQDGTFHGQATMTYADGDKYVGEWRDGKPFGQGVQTHANGDKYVGEVQGGKRHGQGTYTRATNGDEYVGEWKDHKRNGQGVQTFASGSKYVGEFQDNSYHGYGALKFNSAAQGMYDEVLSDPNFNNANLINAHLMGMSSIFVMAEKEWIRAGEWKEGSAVGFANITITHALIAREYINTCAGYGYMSARDTTNLHQELTSGIKTAISRNLVTRDWLNKKNNDVKMAAKIQRPMFGASDIQDICTQYSGLLNHFIVIENEF